MRKAILFICLLALVGCKTGEQAQSLMQPVTLNNTDSVNVEKVIRTLYVPTLAEIDIPRQVETNATPDDSSHVETDMAYSDAWIRDGMLHHTIANKQGKYKTEAFVPQTTEKINREAVVTKEIPVPQPYPIEVERELTMMEQMKLAAFWYLVGAVVVCVCLLFRKPLWAALRKIIKL